MKTVNDVSIQNRFFFFNNRENVKSTNVNVNLAMYKMGLVKAIKTGQNVNDFTFIVQ